MYGRGSSYETLLESQHREDAVWILTTPPPTFPQALISIHTEPKRPSQLPGGSDFSAFLSATRLEELMKHLHSQLPHRKISFLFPQGTNLPW